MAGTEAGRWCAVRSGMVFEESELPRFDRIAVEVERQIISWLQLELEDRRSLNLGGDLKEWEAVIPELITGMRSGDHWQGTPVFGPVG